MFSLRRRPVAAALLVGLVASGGLVVCSTPAQAGKLVLDGGTIGHEAVELTEVRVRYTTARLTVELDVHGNAYDYVVVLFDDADVDENPDVILSGSWENGPGSDFTVDAAPCSSGGDVDPLAGGGETVTLTATPFCFGMQPMHGRFLAISDSGEDEVTSAVPSETEWSETVTPTAENLTAPTVTGTPRVGSTLTASPGTWEPEDASLSYQWLAANTPIAGATGTTYVPKPADMGKKLSVRVTAASGYGPTDATSAQTAAVVAGILVQNAPPAIKGKLRVGRTLTAYPGAWTPSNVKATYQWFAKKPGSSKFVKLAGATTPKLFLKATLAGAKIRVKMRLTRPGYVAKNVAVTTAGTVRR